MLKSPNTTSEVWIKNQNSPNPAVPTLFKGLDRAERNLGQFRLIAFTENSAARDSWKSCDYILT